MRRSMSLAALILVAVAARDARAQDAERHVEKKGGFSFVPPIRWELKDAPNIPYKMAIGPAANNFAPNINVVEEANDRPLNEYVRGNLAVLEKALKKFKLLKQDEFKTDSGLTAGRLITENEQRGVLLRQTFYFFSRDNKKFVITCTSLAEGGEKMDKVFEASVKTFRFEKQ
jgi:hypothetical protein